MGTPTIARCVIFFPCDDPHHPKYAARFLSRPIAGEIDYAKPSATFDLHTKRDVPASQDLQLIVFSRPEFEELTRCSTWLLNCSVNGPFRGTL